VSDHPPLERIVDRVLGASADSDDVRTHLAQCARCREAEAWAQELLAAVTQGPPLTAPESLVDRAILITTAAPRPQSGRGWSLARLLEDAFARPLLAGVRGAATARRMLYEVPGGHVDLEIAADPEDAERVRITAQLLLDEAVDPPRDLIALLWSGNQLVSRAVGDESGTFALRSVDPGDYRMELLSPASGRAIRIVSVVVETGGE
jgi:hypothetical protein